MSHKFTIFINGTYSFLQTLLIEFQPLEKDAIKCRTSVNSVAAVAFYTGDEFLRRQYKK